jgi:hypothetical protein
MKLAISIPDAIFAKAEALARSLNVSRSAIFAMGVDALHPPHDAPSLTDQINAALDEMTEADHEEVRMIVAAGSRTAAKHTEW